MTILIFDCKKFERKLKMNKFSHLHKKETQGELLVSKKIAALDRFEKKNGVSHASSLERAKILIELNKFRAANDLLLKLLNKKKAIEIIQLLGLCNAQLNEDEIFFEILKNNLEHFNYLGSYWSVYALYASKTENFQEAYMGVSEAILKYNECSSENWYLLNSVTRHDYEYEKNYRISNSILETGLTNEGIIEVYLKACMNIGKVDEAIYFLESSDFQWQEFSVINGMAAILYELKGGNERKALELNKKAFELDRSNTKIQWNLSLSQLRTGSIEEGLVGYEKRLEWAEFPSPIRKFIIPKKWHPDVDPESKIMLWWEQGIGDQIRFWSALPLFQKEFPNLVLEPSAKTYEIISSSFPDLNVRYGNLNVNDLTSYEEDFDYHLPIGSMFTYILKKYSDELKQNDFVLDWSFLRADPLRKKFWQSKLQAMSNKPKVGFCWRSSVTNTIRNHGYTVLEQWNELLTSSEFSFVNLQYDLDHEQLITQYPEVEELFLDTGHLDQRDDLEGALSLISNLDFVISPAATPGMMASASGVPTLIYHKPGLWNFGRIGKFVQNPFFKLTRNYHSDDISTDSKLVSDVSNFLIKNKNNFRGMLS